MLTLLCDSTGSPYKPLIVDPVNVRMYGGWRSILDEKGLIPLGVNKEKQLPFDVSDAGPGNRHSYKCMCMYICYLSIYAI